MTARMMLRALALLVVGTSNASAALETFLYIPGVPGESTNVAFKDWIILDSVSVGVENRVCNGFVVTKPLDSSSPILSASALSGILYPSMTVQIQKAGEGQRPFLTYSLTNVVVGSVTLANSPTGYLSEAIVFQPAVIAMTYRPQDDKGGLGSAIQNTLTCKYK